MSVTLELYQLLSLAGGLIGFFIALLFAAIKLLLSQVEKRLEQQFAAQKEGREAAQKHWDAQFASLKKDADEETAKWKPLERELLELKADLPVRYVLRDDWIRNQTVIEAKLDGLALRIENALLKGEGRA